MPSSAGWSTSCATAGVTILRGIGRLVAPDTLTVQPDAGESITVSASRVILAPGSVTARPPIQGLDLPGVVTSTEALDIDGVPASLVVIGGGVIGLEFACIYEALGSRVTVLEMAADDAARRRRRGDRAAAAARCCGDGGSASMTGAQVEEIAAPRSDGLRVSYRDAKGVAASVEADRVLVAAGRWPNTDDLGLAEAGVRLNGRAIAVDDRLATSLPERLGHRRRGRRLDAGAQGDGRGPGRGGERHAAAVARVDYRSVPNVIFTRPEVASVGLTEAQARAQGADVKVSQFPFSANPQRTDPR